MILAAAAKPGPPPKVSVIIPAYNTAAYIGEALDSVFAQTFTDYEVVVVNDGSPDTEELERVLAPYGERIRYLRQANGGVASARNAGIRLARGKYLAMLDSDDIWLPPYLAWQIMAMEAVSRVAASYSNAIIFGDSPFDGRDYMSLYPSEGEVTFERLVEQRCNVLGTSFVRRDAVMAVGLYDETLSTAEDFDLWLRLTHDGWRIIYIREPLWFYRKRAGCLTGNPITGWRNYRRVLEKAQRTLELLPEDRAVVERRCRYINAMIKLYEGKQAFLAGDLKTAVGALTEANDYFKSRKLALAVGLMRVAPRLLLRLYDVRDRFIFGLNTKAELIGSGR